MFFPISHSVTPHIYLVTRWEDPDRQVGKHWFTLLG